MSSLVNVLKQRSKDLVFLDCDCCIDYSFKETQEIRMLYALELGLVSCDEFLRDHKKWCEDGFLWDHVVVNKYRILIMHYDDLRIQAGMSVLRYSN